MFPVRPPLPSLRSPLHRYDYNMTRYTLISTSFRRQPRHPPLQLQLPRCVSVASHQICHSGEPCSFLRACFRLEICILDSLVAHITLSDRRCVAKAKVQPHQRGMLSYPLVWSHGALTVVTGDQRGARTRRVIAQHHQPNAPVCFSRNLLFFFGKFIDI